MPEFITRYAGLALLVALSLPVQAHAQTTTPKGSIVLAKTSPSALLIWDASPVVADLVADKTPDSQALRLLTADAIELLHERAASLTAKTVELRVVYTRSGAISPAYGAPTFAGVERVMVIDASRADALARADQWKKAARDGAPTPGLTVKITGSMPPSA